MSPVSGFWRGLLGALTVLCLALAAVPGVALGSEPQTPTLSVGERLEDRRYVVTGTRAYVVGTEEGRFPAMGFHTRGEMGGIWTPPLKLLDGIWFGVNGRWLRPATRFTSGYGYTRMRIPSPVGAVTRTDFAPDGLRAALIGLEFSGGADERTFTLDVDAHSELMSAYPWGETTPSQLDFNLRDRARFTGRRLIFRERGRPPVANARAHDWAALVGSTLQPVDGETGMGFRGPQSPPVICPATGDAPERCDDTEFGRGAGGRLRYEITVPAGQDRTVWFAVAGSDRGSTAARRELGRALRDPASLLAEKVSHRLSLAQWTQLSIPADPQLAEGIEWSKQNLADSVQAAKGLRVRATHAGVDYPPAEGTVANARFLGAGWPDYPWLFATDGEYVAFASVALGQFESIKDHLRALRDVSDIVNERSGKVVHEVVTEGSVYFGANEDEGNTDETAKFPSAVALVWRWTGDNDFRDEMYGFTVRNMRYVFTNLDEDRDGWPEGLGNVEREGMGEEKLDVAVYTIRGLLDLASMARSKGDGSTARWATRKAQGLLRRFEQAWWMPRVPQHADSLDNPGNAKVQQRHWIGVTPMEAELAGSSVDGFTTFRPGLTTRAHGHRALALRERRCYSEVRGLYHTGAPGCDPVQSTAPAERVIFTLNSAVMAVGEGNYGRLGRDQQQRFTSANRRLQLPLPDEQPGAMPEIAPSPDYGRSIDLPLNERAMVLQAWGAYGTAWPVVHQQLGVRPDLGRGRLEVVPQVPPQYGRLAGERIRLGEGSIDVRASAGGGTYRTTVVRDVRARLRIGHTVPYGSRVVSVTLNGRPVDHVVHRTNRGLEVLVVAGGGARQELVVHAER